MALVFIGLGSNLGDRSANIARACGKLLLHGEFNLLKTSSIEETDPVDYLTQPAFLNQIILIETGISPEKLLEILKEIEKSLGRERTIPKGPRPIDMDILLYDNIILDSPSLVIPHPQIKNREFILRHLIEINRDLVDPETDIPYTDIFREKFKDL